MAKLNISGERNHFYKKSHKPQTLQKIIQKAKIRDNNAPSCIVIGIPINTTNTDSITIFIASSKNIAYKCIKDLSRDQILASKPINYGHSKLYRLIYIPNIIIKKKFKIYHIVITPKNHQCKIDININFINVIIKEYITNYNKLK